MMDIIRAFFPKSGHFFSIFKKGREEQLYPQVACL